jgi:hypothetical protein
LRATQALSQLSYGPELPQCSLEFIPLGPVDPDLLIVSGGREAELNSAPAGESLERKEIALVEIDAVRRERVDLVSRVVALEQSVLRSTAAIAPDYEHVAASRCPLALDAGQPTAKIKDQVVSRAVADRLENVDAELDRRCDYRGFCDRTLLVGSEHDPMLVALSDN